MNTLLRRFFVALLWLGLPASVAYAQAPCPSLPRTIDQGQVPDELELQALRDLFYATNGLRWTNQAGWLQGCSTKECEQWFGVVVRGADVVELQLAGNRLIGELPASLSNLQALKVVRMAHNELTGSLPVSLAQLPVLSELNLAHNQLRGPLPASFHPAGALRADSGSVYVVVRLPSPLERGRG